MYECVPVIVQDMRRNAEKLRRAAAVPKAEQRRTHVMMRLIARDLDRQADRIEPWPTAGEYVP